MRIWIAIGALLGLSGVALGAFGAHALGSLPEEALKHFETAVRYQMYHAGAILVIGLLLRDQPSALLHAAGAAFLVGILIFSGTLYGIALSGFRPLGMLTPIGGVGFIAGWALLAVSVLLPTRANAGSSSRT